MATKRSQTAKKKPLLATLVTENRGPCAFCGRNEDDEITYGKHYAIGDIQCHYFCALLSCCLIQKGKDEEGLFGFMYPDIVAEVERSKKHRCSFCGKGGANLGCCVSHCRKQFHLPCGREHGAVSLFYGNYKSFCIDHAPRQKIPEHIAGPARLREKRGRAQMKRPPLLASLKELQSHDGKADVGADTESVCVICYEPVSGLCSPRTFWPPCCARDGWLHRQCLQRMALSAGMHYLKCPLCNDKEQFYEAVVDQGYYVPDRDAAWELEQNAFAEIYERPLACTADECCCPNGRNHDADCGPWDIKLCILCGTLGIHAECLSEEAVRGRFVCATCRPQAPDDIDGLIQTIEREMQEEQARRATEATPSGPIMPSRMSLRRTKPRRALPSTSQRIRKTEAAVQASPTQNTSSSRLELNLKPPRRSRDAGHAPSAPSAPILGPNVMVNIDSTLLTPLKMLEQGFNEKLQGLCAKQMPKIDQDKVLEELRQTFKRPRPLSAKRRVVNALLEGLFDNVLKDVINTEHVKEWNSPKKSLPTPVKTEATDVENNAPTEDISETDKVRDNDGDLFLHLPIIPNPLTPTKKWAEPGVAPVGKILEICSDDSDDFFEKEPEFVVKIKAELLDQYSPRKAGTEISKMAGEKSTPQNKMADATLDTMADEDSRSTFELPAEFIADVNSDDELPFLDLDTPKKLKTVDIKNDSRLEISNNDASVNIDIINMKDSGNKDLLSRDFFQSTPKLDKCLVKFSPIEKETLKDTKVNIDLESFKNHYLSEIGKDYELSKGDTDLQSVINAVVDTSVKDEKSRRKRKARSGDIVARKKRKNNENEATALKYEKGVEKPETREVVAENLNKKKKKQTKIGSKSVKSKEIVTKQLNKKSKHKKFALKFEGESDKGSGVEIVCSKNAGHSEETIDLTVDTANAKSAKRRKKFKNRKTRENISVKIRLKDGGVNLHITKSESHSGKRKNKNRNKLNKSIASPESPTKLKQYILKYPSEHSSKMICKPDTDVTPKKRNYLKTEKSPDNLIQTSIQSFFKVKPPT